MNEHGGRHSAGPAYEPGDEAFARPEGVDDSFAPRPEPPAYSPPPPTVSPEERAVFGRPPGAAEFAPLPGERIPPRHQAPDVVPPSYAAAYAPPPGADSGFDPAPGSRIAPGARRPEYPWWKQDAASDPWRDPSSPFWLGSGAVFTGGRPSQLDPSDDTEVSEGDEPVVPQEEPTPDVAPVRGGRFGIRALLLALVVALVAGLLGGGVGYLLTKRTDGLLTKGDVTLGRTGTPANRPPGSVADIAARVGPSVVSIAVTTANEYAVGSGVVIDANGYVLTNNHVVSAAQSDGTIVVTVSNEATARAKIVGLDPVSDLAVLKVPTQNLTVAALGDSDKLAVGDPVVAIGSPLGLQGTVTTGIVSALDRAVHVPGENGESDAYLDAIQTDAAINPGNSGGALVGADGAVVGINSAAAVGTVTGGTVPLGIGYAIPINYARDIAQQLIRTGKAVHASLGAQGRTATDGRHVGAYLVQVAPGGPADKAGLANGDVVVVADGKPIVSYDQLVVIVQRHKPGEKLDLTYFHEAAQKTATVTLGSV